MCRYVFDIVTNSIGICQLRIGNDLLHEFGGDDNDDGVIDD